MHAWRGSCRQAGPKHQRCYQRQQPPAPGRDPARRQVQRAGERTQAGRVHEGHVGQVDEEAVAGGEAAQGLPGLLAVDGLRHLEPGLLQQRHRGPPDLRLLEGGEAVVEENDLAGRAARVNGRLGRNPRHE